MERGEEEDLDNSDLDVPTIVTLKDKISIIEYSQMTYNRLEKFANLDQFDQSNQFINKDKEFPHPKVVDDEPLDEVLYNRLEEQ